MTISIIRDSHLNSNKELELSQSQTDSKFSPTYEIYQQWRNAVYEELVLANMDQDAARWLDCETYHRSVWSGEHPPKELPREVSYILACSENPQKHPLIVQKHTCGLRYCPTCAEQHSKRLVERYLPVALDLAKSSRRMRLRHIVLTTPYSLEDDDIGERYKNHQKNIRDVMDSVMRKNWRKNQGYIVGDEFGENGNKLHSHILHFGLFIGKDQLTQAWSNVTGGECEINWIEGIKPDEQSIRSRITEVLKYCTKFWRSDDDGKKKMIQPHLIPKLATVLKGQRRIRTYGVFYNIEIEEEHHEACTCSVCGAEMKKVWRSDWQAFVESGFTWQEIDLAVSDDGLDLKPANKSISQTRIRGKPPPPKTEFLAGFEPNSYTFTD